MFDILSKLGEIKEKANSLKTKLTNESFTYSDDQNCIKIIVNGKKDLLEVKLLDGFEALSIDQKEKLIKDSISLALNDSEQFIIKELKEIIPNIPGMNIF